MSSSTTTVAAARALSPVFLSAAAGASTLFLGWLAYTLYVDPFDSSYSSSTTSRSSSSADSSSLPSPSRSTRLQTAYQVLDAYGSLSVDAMLEPLAEDFTHQVLPESLDLPRRSKEQFGRHAGGIFKSFKSFKMVPQGMFEDDADNAVVARCRMVGELKDGITPEGKPSGWVNECVILLKMSADGKKVVEAREFVDSQKSVQMRRDSLPQVEI